MHLLPKYSVNGIKNWGYVSLRPFSSRNGLTHIFFCTSQVLFDYVLSIFGEYEQFYLYRQILRRPDQLVIPDS